MRASQSLANILVFAKIPPLVTSVFGTKTITRRIMGVSISNAFIFIYTDICVSYVSVSVRVSIQNRTHQTIVYIEKR